MSYVSYEEMITEEARKGAKYAVVVFGWNQPRKVSFLKPRSEKGDAMKEKCTPCHRLRTLKDGRMEYVNIVG